jgi:hypothetical protein
MISDTGRTDSSDISYSVTWNYVSSYYSASEDPLPGDFLFFMLKVFHQPTSLCKPCVEDTLPDQYVCPDNYKL